MFYSLGSSWLSCEELYSSLSLTSNKSTSLFDIRFVPCSSSAMSKELVAKAKFDDALMVANEFLKLLVFCDDISNSFYRQLARFITDLLM